MRRDDAWMRKVEKGKRREEGRGEKGRGKVGLTRAFQGIDGAGGRGGGTEVHSSPSTFLPRGAAQVSLIPLLMGT